MCKAQLVSQVYVLETFLAGQVVHRLPHLFSQGSFVGQRFRQMDGRGILSSFVLSLKVGYRLLQPVQQAASPFGVVGSVSRGVGCHFRPVHRLHRQINQLHRHGRAYGALEQLPHSLPVSLVEPP